MEVVISLNNQTAGRDKVVRLLQYASKFAWHYLQQKQISRTSVDQIKSLEYTFSSFRKLLRLGRFLDVLYGALSSIHYPDITVRVTCTLSRIANALFLLADHILWIGKTGFININVDKWNMVANKYWLYSVVMNLVRDVYEIYKILDREGYSLNTDKCHRPSFSKKQAMPVIQKVTAFVFEHKDVVIDTVKNGCDLLIPMSALGFVRLTPGTVGMLGVISSLAAIVSLVDPMARLTPS